MCLSAECPRLPSTRDQARPALSIFWWLSHIDDKNIHPFRSPTLYSFTHFPRFPKRSEVTHSLSRRAWTGGVFKLREVGESATEGWSRPWFPITPCYWDLLEFRRETDFCLSWLPLLLLFLGVANVADFPPPLLTTQTPHLQVNIDFSFNISSWRNLLLPGPLPSMLAANSLPWPGGRLSPNSRIARTLAGSFLVCDLHSVSAHGQAHSGRSRRFPYIWASLSCFSSTLYSMAPTSLCIRVSMLSLPVDLVGDMWTRVSTFPEPLSFGNPLRFSLKVVYSKNVCLLIRNPSKWLCIAFELHICL